MTHEGPIPLVERQIEQQNAQQVDELGRHRELSAPTPASALRTIRRAGNIAFHVTQRKLSFRWMSLLFVTAIPTLATLGFALFWATPRYQSEFRFSVRAAERMQASSLLPSILGLGTSLSGSDSNAVAQYIISHEILDEMAPDVDLRHDFGEPTIDMFDRLPADATAEALLRYWRGMVEAFYESSTETVVVKVNAYSPAAALEIANRTLALSESLVNRMSSRAREDSVALAKRQVQSAHQQLTALRDQIKTLRDKESLLDPRKEAETDLALAAKLREDLARAEAELSGMKHEMGDSAPSVIATKNRIMALHDEVGRLTAQTVSEQSSARPLSSVFGAFEQLESERQFAEKAYQAALSSQQSAELDATRQQLYLATIVKPNLPQEPSYPRPLRMTALSLIASLLLWGLGGLTLASIREHG